MKLVIIESPYTGDVERNETYARACMADSLARGEAPFASHLLYTQPGVLDDTNPKERAKGIAAGFAWGEFTEACVIYCDLGITPGMVEGLERCLSRNETPEFRYLGAPWSDFPRTVAEVFTDG